MVIFLGILALSFIVIGSAGYFISGPKYKGPVSDHFDGRRFINPGSIRAKGFREVLKWMITRKQGEWKEVSDRHDKEKPAARVDNGIRITFVNHSTFLIQVDGVNILTDPVFSERTSPVSWAGPRRMRPPGIKLEDLPGIDVLLLSHNHWDHLDIGTVKKIHALHHPKIVTPLGVKAFLNQESVTGTNDIDWWEQVEINPLLKVQSVPAQHFSGRGTFDRDATLWCGYVIHRRGGNIYFAGDTGYNDQTFNEIGERCTPIRVALIPIGAYKPKWFMSPIHCSPEEAVKIHQAVRSKNSVATHFGTFPLADDGQAEPVVELNKALQESGIYPDTFLVLKEGVPRDFPNM
jgi:L-ascorbate metabolism protein UlaG (beta-lactamase superfamily)